MSGFSIVPWRAAFSVVCLLLAGAPLHAEWIREVEVKAEPERKGQRDFTVRLLPGQNHRCTQVILECVYHQEFPWQNLWGKKYTKIHEPVSFTYRRRDVKFVNDLDTFVSFRAPVSRERLVKAYGPRVFNKDYPITVPRLTVTGTGPTNTLWRFEVPISGIHKVADLLREKRDPKAKTPLRRTRAPTSAGK